MHLHCLLIRADRFTGIFFTNYVTSVLLHRILSKRDATPGAVALTEIDAYNLATVIAQ
ncbi:hypothetical protein HDF17_001311 [Granulicella arctica]|uniref:Uncharacterized protein n=1 Tax=Granulicella arctica TaxID=940613 RepID=A0A7Y9PFM6_9BACT|nr:hypothetical protein [Granulicella arctica]